MSERNNYNHYQTDTVDDRVVVRHKNVRITFPDDTSNALIVQLSDPSLDGELDPKDPRFKPYINELGELNFIVLNGGVVKTVQ